MFKKTDPNPQLDIFTAPSMQLGSRASKKYSAPPARPRTAVLGCIIEGRTAITTPPKPF